MRAGVPDGWHQSDINYSRNRIRHHILPELSVINEQAVSHINQSALLLQQAVSYMEQETKKPCRHAALAGAVHMLF